LHAPLGYHQPRRSRTARSAG